MPLSPRTTSSKGVICCLDQLQKITQFLSLSLSNTKFISLFLSQYEFSLSKIQCSFLFSIYQSLTQFLFISLSHTHTKTLSFLSLSPLIWCHFITNPMSSLLLCLQPPFCTLPIRNAFSFPFKTHSYFVHNYLGSDWFLFPPVWWQLDIHRENANLHLIVF